MSLNKHTVCDLFLHRVNSTPKLNAIGVIEKRNPIFSSFKSYKENIEALSIALINIGLTPFTKVSILSQTRREWHYFDLAIMCARGVTVPIYPTYSEEEVEYILNHAEAEILIVENTQQLEKIINNIKALTKLKKVVSIESINSDVLAQLPVSIKLHTYEECISLGLQEALNHPDKFNISIQNVSPSDLATIVYTSGTTGEPKGAMITHHALFQVLQNVKKYSHSAFDSSDRLLIYLPLSHVLGRCESYFTILFGLETVYAESINKVMVNIGQTSPTIMLGVPRIFEKIYENIMAALEENPLKKEAFNLAMKVADEYFNRIDNDMSPSSSLIIKYQLAKKLLFQKVQERFGGRIRFFISGGAPLSPKIIKFLRNIGLTVLEGYGLTETVAPCCVNPMNKQVAGSVGQPIGDVEIKFLEDGEILIKSTALFSGYYKNEEATKEVLDEDGWFHTGDIGEFDRAGFLKITDRKKDLIITSGGKNVAPQKIENMLKLSPYISQSVIIGDQKKYLSALIALDMDFMHKKLADMGLSDTSDIKDLANNSTVISLIEQEILDHTTELASFETIKKFKIIPVECTTDNYLTPSMKLKKKNITKDFQNLIEAMYNS